MRGRPDRAGNDFVAFADMLDHRPAHIWERGKEGGKPVLEAGQARSLARRGIKLYLIDMKQVVQGGEVVGCQGVGDALTQRFVALDGHVGLR